MKVSSVKFLSVDLFNIDMYQEIFSSTVLLEDINCFHKGLPLLFWVIFSKIAYFFCMYALQLQYNFQYHSETTQNYKESWKDKYILTNISKH